MLKLSLLALLSLFVVASASAATLPPCDFGKFAGAVMPVPSSKYQKYRIFTGDANVSVTQAVPVVPGHILWACQTAGANWQQCWSSPNTNACGSAAPIVSTASTDWEPNPICRKLDSISGTTVSDIPSSTGVSSDTSNTWIGGSYCYQ